MTLIDYCETDRQREVVGAYIEHGNSSEKAGGFLEITPRSVRKTVSRVKEKASKKGYDPDIGLNRPVAKHEILKGRSELVDQDGNVKLTWYKTTADQIKAEAWRDVAQEFFADLPKVPVPDFIHKEYSTDIIPWFNIGDAHIGMVAYEPEVGHNFDLKIAESELCKAMEILIDQTPVTERCVIQDMGDGTHAENFAAVTEASGHALDLDTRFPKMIHVYIRTMR